jgi:hypothetical protein
MKETDKPLPAVVSRYILSKKGNGKPASINEN